MYTVTVQNAVVMDAFKGQKKETVVDFNHHCYFTFRHWSQL